jgi:uncharacterized small protein (DUF1192 family)
MNDAVEEAAMKDLTKLTRDETQECVEQLSVLSLEELRQRMDLVAAQIDWATRQKDDAALANLQVMKVHLRLALAAKLIPGGTNQNRNNQDREPEENV